MVEALPQGRLIEGGEAQLRQAGMRTCIILGCTARYGSLYHTDNLEESLSGGLFLNLICYRTLISPLYLSFVFANISLSLTFFSFLFFFFPTWIASGLTG